MAVTATTRGTISRIAASGAPVELSLPEAFGEFRWYGSTRFTGPRTARQFLLAPAGEHRAVPTHALPGATRRVQPMRGFDALLFEAPDRSDAALVLAGPHHEATTWFGGPAPDAAGLTALLTSLRFTDSPRGASLTPVSDLLLAQRDTSLIGRSRAATVVARPAVDALPSLPDWSGLALPGGELWRADRVLDARSAAAVAGTPHRWRFLFAGDSVAMDVVLLGPESGRPPTALSEDAIAAALGTLAGTWAAPR
jgi:hypothetical protein